MKFDRNKAFPYPVLRPHCDDYIDVEFQTTVEFSVEKDKVALQITYAVSSEDLLKEVEKGNARYVSVVSCRDTYFRTVLASNDGHITADFDDGQLRGEVRVDPYIVVVKRIAGFQSTDINPEFGDGKFDFSPGDVLAQDETQVFYIDRDLFKPVTSVFELVKNESLSGGEWRVGLEEDRVQIEVSPAMKAAIDGARDGKENRVVLLNSIYFSAVVQAVHRLQAGGADYKSKKWAEVILRQLHNNSWDLEAHDAYVLAQRLMKYPLAMLGTYIFKGASDE